MNDLMNLEKLAELRDKGVISAADFEEQKKLLFSKAMRESEGGQPRKNGIVYIFLAWFLGTIGIHNFYAGYWGRGLIQLLLTLFSWMFFFLPIIVTSLWALGELLFENKSAGRIPFAGNPRIILGLKILAVVILFAAFYFSNTIFDAPLPMGSAELNLQEFNAILKN